MYSLSALHGLLPDKEYAHWSLFVEACSILCSRVISHSAIDIAHSLLLKFCEEFGQVYGNQAINMNQHLHCHLKECLIDYGPVYSFWLFSFERQNGILGSFPTNNHNIEPQLMKKFVLMWQLKYSKLEQVQSLLQDIELQKVHKGTLALQIQEETFWIPNYDEKERIQTVYTNNIYFTLFTIRPISKYCLR